MKALTTILTITATLVVSSSTYAISAYDYGYELKMIQDITNNLNFNAPIFNLTNIGTAEITNFSLTIGDTRYNYDAFAYITSDSAYTLLSPDTVNANVRSNIMEISFDDMAMGDVFRANVDIDPDPSSGLSVQVDAREVLFNNNGRPNAVVTVDFDNGETLTGTLPDYPTTYSDSDGELPGTYWQAMLDDYLRVDTIVSFEQEYDEYPETYIFSQAATRDTPTSEVPAPSAALGGMMLIGAMNIFGMIKRRRNQEV